MCSAVLCLHGCCSPPRYLPDHSVIDLAVHSLLVWTLCLFVCDYYKNFIPQVPGCVVATLPLDISLTPWWLTWLCVMGISALSVNFVSIYLWLLLQFIKRFYPQVPGCMVVTLPLDISLTPQWLNWLCIRGISTLSVNFVSICLWLL